jgi:precorrin-6x reductase
MILLRHGQSEFNLLFTQTRKDPGIKDPRLTSLGHSQAEAAADRPAWVVDATHPFASRISADLAAACRLRGQPLVRLQRPLLPLGHATLLPDLNALTTIPLAGRSLLLAIGARHLASAVSHSEGARHHARVLPSPAALASSTSITGALSVNTRQPCGPAACAMRSASFARRPRSTLW